MSPSGAARGAGGAVGGWLVIGGLGALSVAQERFMTKLRSIDPPSLYPGVPYHYAMIAPAGRMIFTAGACPLDAHGEVVTPGDLEAQTRQALDNLVAVLREAGSTLEQVLKTTVFVAASDRSDLLCVWKVIEKRFAPARPPSTLLGVSVLGYKNQLVEIEAVALA